MQARCIDLYYQPGDYKTVQRIKGGVGGTSYYKKGKIHQPQGFGWEKQITPSKLILAVENGGECYEILVDKFFKKSVGRLTEKRRNKIRECMPETISIEQYENSKGRNYYVATEADLDKWLNSTGL